MLLMQFLMLLLMAEAADTADAASDVVTDG